MLQEIKLALAFRSVGNKKSFTFHAVKKTRKLCPSESHFRKNIEKTGSVFPTLLNCEIDFFLIFVKLRKIRMVGDDECSLILAIVFRKNGIWKGATMAFRKDIGDSRSAGIGNTEMAEKRHNGAVSRIADTPSQCLLEADFESTGVSYGITILLSQEKNAPCKERRIVRKSITERFTKNLFHKSSTDILIFFDHIGFR